MQQKSKFYSLIHFTLKTFQTFNVLQRHHDASSITHKIVFSIQQLSKFMKFIEVK